MIFDDQISLLGNKITNNSKIWIWSNNTEPIESKQTLVFSIDWLIVEKSSILKVLLLSYRTILFYLVIAPRRHRWLSNSFTLPHWPHKGASHRLLRLPLLLLLFQLLGLGGLTGLSRHHRSGVWEAECGKLNSTVVSTMTTFMFSETFGPLFYNKG